MCHIFFLLSSKDIYAIATLPLPGYQVVYPVDNGDNVFILSHQQQRMLPTYLQTECSANRDRWVVTMTTYPWKIKKELNSHIHIEFQCKLPFLYYSKNNFVNYCYFFCMQLVSFIKTVYIEWLIPVDFIYMNMYLHFYFLGIDGWMY